MSQKLHSKQITITEMEAFYINDLLKDRVIQMARTMHPDIYVVVEIQKKYEGILEYIRRKAR